MRNNGETNPGTYVVAVVLAAAGFYAFHVAPVYWDNIEVKEAASEALSMVVLAGEESARTKLLFRLNNNLSISHYEVDDEGVESVKPGFGLTQDNIKIEIDDKTKKIAVRIEYDRVIEFSPLKKRKSYHCVAEKLGTIK